MPAPAPNAAPVSDGWLRDAITNVYQQMFPPVGSPIEQQYNPLEAGNIAAGAATTSGINQIKHYFQRGSGALAEAGGMPEEAARMRGLADQTGQQIESEGALYAPMREAYPYATAIGEAAPALVPGGIAAFRTQAGFNMGREYLNEIAKATQSARLAQLVKALRGF